MNYELFDHGDKKIYLVDMIKEEQKVFSELFEKGISKYLFEKKRIGILINKKGFDSGIICQKCGHIPQCNRCSVAINYYLLPSGDKIGMCHICKTQYLFPKTCDECGSDAISEYGLGTQKLAQIIKDKYGADSIIVESETANSSNKIVKIENQLLEAQSNNQIPIIIGTSLLTTPIKNWNFDLLVIFDADIGLSVPDYNATEKNFYFLYETFVKHSCKNFVVQTLNPQQYSIRYACKMDKQGFYREENLFREKYLYPPYGEICLILYKDEIEQKLYNKVDQLYKDLLYLQEKYGLKDMEIYTTPPLIYKIFGKYRYNVVIKGKNVREFMDIIYSKLQLNRRGFKINWMAESIV